MTELLQPQSVLLFTLLVARASGLIVAAPFLGERIVPRKVKILFAIALAFLMYSTDPVAPEVPAGLPGLVFLAGAELTVGLVIGFLTRLLLLAFEMAGQVVAIQMGLAVAQVFDPINSTRQNILGRWMWLVGMACFLGMGGHHFLLRALAGSLDILPVGQGLLNHATVELMVRSSGESLATALSIAAPAIGVLLLTSLGLGILARTVPQINVFIVGFPVKIAAGIAAIIASLPYVLEVARREVAMLAGRLATLFAAA